MTDTVDPMTTLLAAARYAADQHAKQRRKGGGQRPYIGHPIDVAETIARVGGVRNVEVLCAALLHDTVEDTDATDEELERRFGATVTSLVREMTDDKTLPSSEQKRLQVVNAPHKSRDAKAIKLGDKICNVGEIGTDPPPEWDVQRRRQYFDWAERVVNALRGEHPALERLFDETVASSRAALERMQ